MGQFKGDLQTNSAYLIKVVFFEGKRLFILLVTLVVAELFL